MARVETIQNLEEVIIWSSSVCKKKSYLPAQYGKVWYVGTTAVVQPFAAERNPTTPIFISNVQERGHS